MMKKVLKEQKQKVIEQLEQLAEDAAFESYESGGRENVDNVLPYYRKICKILNIKNS